jgi:hypothetical protein
MAITNASDLIKFWHAEVSASEKAGFNSRFGLHPTELKAGTELYKYSKSFPYTENRGRWSPWWHFRKTQRIPLTNGSSQSIPGLGDHLQRAESLGVSDVRLARVRSSVTHEWNDLHTLFLVYLTVSAWAMFGQNSGLGISETDQNVSNVFYIGGNFQIYIPRLARDDLHSLGAFRSGVDTGK